MPQSSSAANINVDINKIATDLNLKADTNLINATPSSETVKSLLNNSGVRYVVETYSTGPTWYRVYSDGWVEQGGNIPFTATGGWAAGNITFLKPFKDTNYYINGRGNWSDRQSCDFGLNSKTATGVNVTVAINTLTGENGAWYACGYAE